MGLLDSTVKKGRETGRPLRMLVYGVPKIGKSTLVSGAPEPLIVDADHKAQSLDCARVQPETWEQVRDTIQALTHEQHAYKTVGLDTLNSLERLLVEYVCRTNHVTTIEKVGGGYGKGWTEAGEEWGRLLADLERLQRARRVNVIALAHAKVDTFRDPRGTEYQRWTLDLSKQTASAWKGWVEDILFATRDVRTRSGKDRRETSGERVLFTGWTAGVEAGNCRQLPGRIPLSWAALSTALRAAIAADKARASDQVFQEHTVEPGEDEVEDPTPAPGAPPAAATPPAATTSEAAEPKRKAKAKAKPKDAQSGAVATPAPAPAPEPTPAQHPEPRGQGGVYASIWPDAEDEDEDAQAYADMAGH